MKNILDVEKSVYICSERLRGTDNYSIKITYFCLYNYGKERKNYACRGFI